MSTDTATTKDENSHNTVTAAKDESNQTTVTAATKATSNQTTATAATKDRSNQTTAAAVEKEDNLKKTVTIGVLAVQGAFIEHEQMLQSLGISCIEIRKPEQLDRIDGIILPGGESTVQGQLLQKLHMLEPLREMIQNGLPVLATCAGLILLAEEIDNGEPSHLGTLPATVKRNAYGRQLGSFCTTADLTGIPAYPMVFIRAPYIASVKDSVKVLGTVDGHIIAVQYRQQIGLSFHPELTGDTRIHEYFVKMVTDSRKNK